MTRQCYRGRTRTSRRPRISRHAGYTQSTLLQANKRTSFGAVTSIRLQDHLGDARTCHRRRRACATRASRMLGIRNMQLAGSPAVANRPAEAALCLESRASTRTRVYHPNVPDLARTFRAHGRPIPIRDQCQLEVGWARLARTMRLAPTTSLDSRSNARGRSDLPSPNDEWTSQTHDISGVRQDRRGMNAASSPFRKNGVSRLAATGRSGFREQIDGIGWPRATLCIDTRDPRDDARVPRAG